MIDLAVAVNLSDCRIHKLLVVGLLHCLIKINVIRDSTG